jgi:hypothetical protein
MTDPIVLTNPLTHETYTFGTRGRRPAWVMAMINNGSVVPPAPKVAVKGTVSVTPSVTGSLRVWKWTGWSGEEGNDEWHMNKAHCMIIDESPEQAIMHGSLTMSAITKHEFEIGWKEITDQSLLADIHAGGINITEPNVWHVVDKKWVVRNKKVT